MRGFLTDLRSAARSLCRDASFTAAVVLTLGLAIGVAAAMFAIVDALLLRPLPYADPDALVRVEAVSSRSGRTLRYVDREEARAFAERADFLDATMLHVRRSVMYTAGAEPRMLTVEAVSPEFEQTLGVHPVIGRGFVPSDAEPAAEPVALLSHGFWRAAFGADTLAVGRMIEVDGTPHGIIGVMPERFTFPSYATTELWVPLRADGTAPGRAAGPARSVHVLGRVGRGGIEPARARTAALAAALAEELDRGDGWSLTLTPFTGERASNTGLRRAVWFLAGAVGVILIIAAANGAALLLVRGWARTRELAVRTALGASRGRLVRQLVAEGALFGLAAGVAAVALAVLALYSIGSIMPEMVSFWAPYAIEVERRTVAFAFGVAAVVGLLIGAIPAIQVAGRGHAAAEAALTPYAVLTPARSRARRLLMVVQLGVSVALLTGAGLLGNSFVRLVRVDPGFGVDNLAILNLSFSDPDRTDGPASSHGTFLRRLEERLEALPGVEGVALGGGSPLASGFHVGTALEAEGSSAAADRQPEVLPFAQVSSDFFDVFQVPVIAGRRFRPDDVDADRVMVDRDLARHLWGDADPVGRRFRVSPRAPWLTVVGVVGDLALMGPDDRTGDYEILYPTGVHRAAGFVGLGIRTRGDPRPLLRSIRAAIHDLDPVQPIAELKAASELYAQTIALPRFLLVVMSVLAALALLLAAVGLYGVLSFAVAQRWHELAVRIAVGAPPAVIARAVLAEGVLLALAGAALGVAAAIASSGLIRGLLYGVEPTDPATIIAVVLIGIATAAVAAYRPARRAASVDPAELLKVE